MVANITLSLVTAENGLIYVSLSHEFVKPIFMITKDTFFRVYLIYLVEKFTNLMIALVEKFFERLADFNGDL